MVKSTSPSSSMFAPFLTVKINLHTDYLEIFSIFKIVQIGSFCISSRISHETSIDLFIFKRISHLGHLAEEFHKQFFHV